MATKKRPTVTKDLGESWGVRIPADLLARLRVVCAQRRAKKRLPNTQRQVAAKILEDWLKKVGG